VCQEEGTGGWFHSSGGFPSPRGAAGRRWHVLSVLLRQRRAELEKLRQRARAVLDEIAELESLRREWPTAASGESATGRGMSGEAFWSPRPILGFRCWRLTRQGVRGVVQVWPQPRLEAFCPRGPGVPHDSPGCRCGVYAFKEAGALLGQRWGASSAPLVHGLVVLTGKVVEHERGYRAQRAEVQAAAVLRPNGVAWGSESAWIEALFASGEGPDGFGGAEARPVRGGDSSRRAVEYLGSEARRFQEAWTSESKRG